MIDVSTVESIVGGALIVGGIFLLKWWRDNAQKKAARGPLPSEPKIEYDGKGNVIGEEDPDSEEGNG